MRILLALATAVLLCGGSAVTMHSYDARNAAQTSVRDYNDGFVDGVCTGSHTVAFADYGQTCKGN